NLNFKFEGSGASYNTELATRNLVMDGEFRVNDAVFASIDVSKMTTEALNKALSQVGEKVPQLGQKKVKGLPSGQTKYTYLQSGFSMKNGKFQASNFVAKAAERQG